MPVLSGKVEQVKESNPFTFHSKFSGQDETKCHLLLKVNGESFTILFHTPGYRSPVKVGDVIEAMYNESENNGYLNRNIDKKTLQVIEEGDGQPVQSAPPQKKQQQSKETNMDKPFKSVDNRQESICFQNAMGHAVNIITHNSKDKKVKIEDVLELAKIIARVSVQPELNKVEEKKVKKAEPKPAKENFEDLEEDFGDEDFL